MSSATVKKNKDVIKQLLDRIHPMFKNFFLHTQEKHLMTGAELKAMGYVEKDGEILLDATFYNYNYPVITDMNHERRIRRAFKRNGYEGVNMYLMQLLNAGTVSTQPKEGSLSNNKPALL